MVGVFLVLFVLTCNICPAGGYHVSPNAWSALPNRHIIKKRGTWINKGGLEALQYVTVPWQWDLWCSADGDDGDERQTLRDRRKSRRNIVNRVESPKRTVSSPEEPKDIDWSKGNEDAMPFPAASLASSMVDSEMSIERITNEHVRFYGFDQIFPDTGFSDIFDTNSAFRSDLRVAAREDFYVSDSKFSAQVNTLLKDPRSTLMSYWKRDSPSASSVGRGNAGNDESAKKYSHITSVFRKYGMASNLTGDIFIGRLSTLCGDTPYVFGSWIDIVGAPGGTKGRKVAHRWHQDSGLDQSTVMVGFPSSDGYHGTGVFSHAVKLSHRLPPHSVREPRVWEKDGGRFNEEYIVRPIYSKGKEIMVYNDRDLFHSAPDFTNRQSVWRFM